MSDTTPTPTPAVKPVQKPSAPTRTTPASSADLKKIQGRQDRLEKENLLLREQVAKLTMHPEGVVMPAQPRTPESTGEGELIPVNRGLLKDKFEPSAKERFGIMEAPGFHLSWWPVGEWGTRRTDEEDLNVLHVYDSDPDTGQPLLLNPQNGYVIDEEHGFIEYASHRLYWETSAHYADRQQANRRELTKRMPKATKPASFEEGARRESETEGGGLIYDAVTQQSSTG